MPGTLVKNTLHFHYLNLGMPHFLQPSFCVDYQRTCSLIIVKIESKQLTNAHCHLSIRYQAQMRLPLYPSGF